MKDLLLNVGSGAGAAAAPSAAAAAPGGGAAPEAKKEEKEEGTFKLYGVSRFRRIVTRFLEL